MLKRFLVAAIVSLFVMSSQLAAAEDYDWNKAKRIGTKAELANYVESERRKGQTVFHVVLTNESILPNTWQNRDFDKNEFYNLVVCHDVEPSIGWIDGKSMGIPFKLIEYPGTHVANAYRNGDKSKLTTEEQNIYNIAVGIVAETNKRSSEREKARYIHDVICERVLEYKVGNERNETAIGALIDGYAQCQGYSDAFYMLGRMAGLNIGRIRGHINENNGLHIWNMITFNDGKTYFVDVTNDDLSNTDIFFCATKETMQKYVSCEWEIIPNLQ